MINIYHPHMILHAQAELAEGPLWHPEEERLYWTSILAKELHCLDPVSGKDTCFPANIEIGSFAFARSGGFIAACTDGFYRITIENGMAKTYFLCDPDRERGHSRFNDGKCDSAGRFLAGSIHLENVSGGLYSIGIDKNCVKLLDNISVANGISFSLDNKTLYYIDSPTRTIMAYDYDVDIGSVGKGKICIEITEGIAVPDGMTIDSDGNLWVALWQGGKVVCYNPHSGKVLAEVITGVSRTSSCIFGGKDYSVLYITTAWERALPEERMKEPFAGDLFCVDVGVKGLASYTFGG
jgi:sugar lactone lactonase YvrE